MDVQSESSHNRQRRNRTAIVGGVILGLVAVLFVIIPDFAYLFAPHYHGTVLWDAPQVADFGLPRADGGTFRLSSYKGQVVVLYFGYTSCADVCPATLYNLNRMVKNLGSKSQGVTVAFVTVDPQNDTPQKMTAYLSTFNPTFIGLLGTGDQLQPVYDEFGITVLRADQGQAAASAGIGHTSTLFVIDQRGRMRVQLHEGDTAQNITADVQNILNESPS